MRGGEHFHETRQAASREVQRAQRSANPRQFRAEAIATEAAADDVGVVKQMSQSAIRDKRTANPIAS